jgi:quercetin dioxygenase-like cupin family protein
MSTNSGGPVFQVDRQAKPASGVWPTAVRSTCHYKRRKKRVRCFGHLLNGEAIMRFRTTGTLSLSLSLGAMAFGASVDAQTTPAPPAITRTVIAATKLSTVTDVPLYFKAVSVTLPSGEKSSVSAANSIVYQISGSTEVSLDGETKMLNAGDGLFIAGGKTSVLKAGSGAPSSFLHFFLAPAADLDRPAEQAPAAVRELYRTAAPIPDLKPGSYDLNLTRVTFPAQMPSNPPHHRSGAALYYIISGTGANTVDGTTTEKVPGSLIYEPYALVHQWGNPGSEPLTFLAFNINPEGVAAVLPGTPPKNQ